MMNNFRDSQSESDRRLTWDAIRRSPMNNNERTALRYLVNLWFVHRFSSGVIHPGAEKIAKKCGFSVRTAKRALAKFRAEGFINPVRYSKGGTNCATQYTVSVDAIWRAFLRLPPEMVAGDLGEVTLNQTVPKPCQNRATGPENRANLAHCLKGRTSPRFSQEMDGNLASLEAMAREIWSMEGPSQEDTELAFMLAREAGDA